MSAINVFLTPEAAVMQTDAAWVCAQTGVLVRIASKVVAIPYLDAAIGFRCFRSGAARAAAQRLQASGTLDELLASAPAVLRAEFEAEGEDPDRDATMVVACWSRERHRAECWTVSDKPRAGHAPWALILSSRGYLSPIDREMVAALGSQGPVGPSSWRAIAEHQRSMRLPCAPAAGVGGFLEQVSIGPAGIVREVLHRWPDVVGQHIELGEFADA